MKTSFISKIVLAIFLFAVACTDHEPNPDPQSLSSAEFVKNLKNPFAITKGPNGYLWITEVGSGSDDGSVAAIAPEGTVYHVYKNFKSEISPEDGLPTGLAHLTYKDDTLYVVQGLGGLLYKIDISHWQAGNEADASTLPHENIGDFVLKNAPFTHLYNLTWGPEGHLYFTDAAANLVVHRKAAGNYSVFTKFDQVVNPLPVPPGNLTDFVPTGIVYDGSKFIVSSLTGFPFNKGFAALQKVTLDGVNSVYKPGFTLLTGVVLTASNKPLALQYGTFTFNPPVKVDYDDNTGQILDENHNVLLTGIQYPTDIERTDDHTYYMVSMNEGKIFKLTY